MSSDSLEAICERNLNKVAKALQRRFQGETVLTAAEIRVGLKVHLEKNPQPRPMEEAGFSWLFGLAIRQQQCQWIEKLATQDDVKGIVASYWKTYCRNRVSAKDLLQDGIARALAAILQKTVQLPQTSAAAKRWLLVICKHRAIEIGRKHMPESLPELMSLPAAESERETPKDLHDCIARLPQPQRQAVMLLLEGLKPGKIARQLSIEDKTVYVLIRKAKSNLKACLVQKQTEEASNERQ